MNVCIYPCRRESRKRAGARGRKMRGDQKFMGKDLLSNVDMYVSELDTLGA